MKKNSLAPLALACACCSAFRGPLSPLRAAARVVQLDHSVGGAPVPVDGADGVSALEAELQSALVAARNESARALARIAELEADAGEGARARARVAELESETARHRSELETVAAALADAERGRDRALERCRELSETYERNRRDGLEFIKTTHSRFRSIVMARNDELILARATTAQLRAERESARAMAGLACVAVARDARRALVATAAGGRAAARVTFCAAPRACARGASGGARYVARAAVRAAAPVQRAVRRRRHDAAARRHYRRSRAAARAAARRQGSVQTAAISAVHQAVPSRRRPTHYLASDLDDRSGRGAAPSEAAAPDTTRPRDSWKRSR